MSGEGVCQASEFDGAMVCERCCLAWDVDDKPPPCAAVTFTRLRDAALAEAERIEQSQRALVAAGLRAHRYQPALARALELRRLARLVELHKAKEGKK